MKKIQYAVCALAVALMVPLTRAQSQPAGLQAAFAKDAGTLSDNDLQTPVKLFGRDWTKQDALMHILEDQHEHLGQSIAYARSNGVVPPWSK